MDRISPLPDELLLRILSFLPTKEVVPTMVLSKRWKPLWMLVPNLEYDDTNHSTEYSRFFRFVQCSLFLHKAPVLESLCFKLGPRCGAVDMEIWVKLAVSRCLRKLVIGLSNDRRLVRLPESLYTCKTLEFLFLRGALLVDVPDSVCLSSLVSMGLDNVTYSSDESVLRLLSGCPILAVLVVRLFEGDNVMTFTVKVPSLKGLDIARESEDLQNNNHGIVIDAPSLMMLNITDHSGGFCLVKNTPKVGKAKIDVIYNNSEKLLVSLTSVRHLRLCLQIPKPAYPQGSIFHLRNLELCTCTEGWLDLLMSLLQDSPKLRVLKLTLNHVAQTARRVWNKPSSVPECCSSNLKTFEWSSYKGTQEERELVKFILRNGKSLRTVIISSKSTNLKQKFQMMKELTLSPRASPTCELVFN